MSSLSSRSRLSSADLLGGGGEGGCEGGIRGDFRGSNAGVRGRLGTTKGFAVETVEEEGDVDLTKESVLTKAGRSPVANEGPRFGGD